MILNKEKECMSRKEIKALQDERLRWQVKRMYEKVEIFKKRMDEKGLKPEDIHGIEDLPKLPFSYKKDLRDYYPYGLFAVPMTDIVRVHASSGTTGKQIVVGYTKHDLEIWSECMARQLSAAGGTKDDFVQVCYGYGLFTGGLGAHDGATYLGATVIPASTGNTARQIQTMVDFGSTILCSTPSYAMYLGEEIKKQGLVDKIKLKAAVCGAEPWTEEMRKQIEETLHIKAYDVYGLSEIMGPGVSYECECQKGMHINEDNFIAEIIDPETGEVLPYGAKGELVFTTLTKEGFPLIRYRTRDICSLNPEPCKCGRTFIRMNKPTGRSDDMMIIRGVNVFPSQIETVLLKCGYTPNYQIMVDRIGSEDTFDINVELSEEQFKQMKEDEDLEKARKSRTGAMVQMLGIRPKMHLLPPKSIVRSEGKAVRVVDKRKLHD